MSEKKFEDQLKKKFEEYELPVSPAVWQNVLKGAGTKSPLISTSYKWLIAGMVAGGALIGVYFSYNNSSEDSLPQNKLVTNTDSSDGRILNADSAHSSDAHSTVQSNGETGLQAESPTSPKMGDLANANTPADEMSSGSSLKNERKLSTQESQIISNTFSTAKTHCVGAEVSFNSPSTPDDVSFLWNFGDGSFSNESNPKHKYLNPGTYVVSLSISGHKSAQINTMNMSETITILTTPKADFEWTFDKIETGNPVVSIDNNSQAAASFEWYFHDGKKSAESKPRQVTQGNGNFPISITAIHENGCRDTKVKYISINDNAALHAPAQTLAGEGFMPEGLKDFKGSFTMSIFDNGKRIFETKTIKRPWTGIDSNGRYHDVNKQYSWVIITKDNKSGSSNYYSGKVLLKP